MGSLKTKLVTAIFTINCSVDTEYNTNEIIMTVIYLLHLESLRLTNQYKYLVSNSKPFKGMWKRKNRKQSFEKFSNQVK